MIAFKDVEKKYGQALEYMALNEESALNESNNPPHATWIHPPTLARWFYGSSQEFIRDYDGLSQKLISMTPEQSKQISSQLNSLVVGLEIFRIKLRDKFSQNFLLMEATK